MKIEKLEWESSRRENVALDPAVCSDEKRLDGWIDLLHRARDREAGI